MCRELIQFAKRSIPEIIQAGETLERNEALVLLQTPNGCKLEKVEKVTALIGENGQVIDPQKILFLGHPLKPSDVTRVIHDAEYLEYLKD